MQKIKNQIIEGKHQKPILLDSFFKKDNKQKPVIIFAHGYKGFKDWGAWDLMSEEFAKNDFFFIKFNFSHNGGTIEQPIDFPDLEAFANNNYTKELDDLETVIDWIITNDDFKTEADTSNISLIGHSRGGAISTIKAEEDTRVKQLITLASVSGYKNRFPQGEAFENWKKTNVYFVKNGRTKQDMPHYFQFFEDFEANEERLTVKRAVENLKIPHLIIHGDNDKAVLLEEAENKHKWDPKSTLEIIKDANHVFGASHPWQEKELPHQLKQVTQLCIDFL